MVILSNIHVYKKYTFIPIIFFCYKINVSKLKKKVCDETDEI